MDLKQHFTSRDNIMKLSNKICNHLDITPDNNEGKKGVKEALDKIMPLVWKSNIENIRTQPIKYALAELNKKSIENIVKRVKTNHRQQSPPQQQQKSVSQMGIDREKEIFGDRKIRLQRQSMPTKREPKSGIMESDINSGFAGFASFNPAEQGEYVRADGSMGLHFQTNVNQRELLDGDRKKSEIGNDIESRFAQLEQERGYQGGGNNGGDMPYMYNSGQNQIKPNEINFSLDGGNSSRGNRKNDEQDDQQQIENFGGIYNGIGNMNGYETNFDAQYQMPQMPMQFNQMTQNQNQMTQNQNQMNQFQNQNMPNYQNPNPNQNPINQFNMPQQENNNPQMETIMTMFQQMMMMMMNNNNTANNELNALSQVNNEYKTTIANDLGIDPQSILNLSSAEIGKLISEQKKEAKNKNKDKNKNNEKKENEKKEKLLQKIIELKNENIKKQQTLHKHTKNKKRIIQEESSDSESESESENSNSSSSSSSNESESEKTSDDSSSSESEKRPIKKAPIINKSKQPPQKKDKINTKTLTIKSNEVEKNPQHYNDYLVEFENYFNLKSVKSIKNISLNNVDINFCVPINSIENTFIIKVHNGSDDSDDDSCSDDNNDNDKIYEIVFEEGNYTIAEIVNNFNKYCENEGCDVRMKEKNGFVVISHLNKEKFTIDCTNKSIGNLLGFTEKQYSNSFKYTAEIRHAFNEKPMYLYFLNINEENPFAKINPDGSFEQLIKKFNDYIDLNFIVQFRALNKRDDDDDETNIKELINFGNLPHEITLKLEYTS
ncbi:hypothetical protein BMW23_0676 [Bodo saltans virus]|uniref:Uncharacterized protein n=1 Tax=Bodo saltans virus TaxID=2024608 RepID=A0A2H4UUX1_9VIRU|nr:hypothetical protein QJ851_gp0659 [Bodo saltans virus]ATZ80722.1 hypothetical protein BMW23_0676 [Bodo saltans virus]